MSSLVTKQTHQKTDPSETNPFFYFLFGVLGGGGQGKRGVCCSTKPALSQHRPNKKKQSFVYGLVSEVGEGRGESCMGGGGGKRR